MDNPLFWAYAALIIFIIYHYFVFELADSILENSKLKKGQRFIIGSINAGIMAIIIVLFKENVLASYSALLILLIVEFLYLYDDSLKKILFVAIAFPMHIMVLRSIVVASISFGNHQSFMEITHTPILLFFTLSLTFIFAIIAILCVLKFIPARLLKIVSQHQEQLFFVTLWMGVTTLFFLLNSSIYEKEPSYRMVNNIQLTISIASLLGVYIMLFFVMKTGELLGYKEKNENLLVAVHNEQQFRDSITSDAIDTYEFNLTKGIILKGLEKYSALINKDFTNYAEAIEFLGKKLIYPDDFNKFITFTHINYLLSEFTKGKNEIYIEYRRIMPNNEYRWVRTTCTFVRDSITGDIKGFAYVKDIHEEKLKQLELKFLSERDSLTGLYNKSMTEKLISDFLNIETSYPQVGALFMIDVDNFKVINDRLGHTFGDVVLCELADKLRTIFRSTTSPLWGDDREDIIGRVGGDEFMVFIKGINNVKILSIKAESICNAFLNTYSNNENENYTITASIGIALFPQNGKSFIELYEEADIALYLSKGKGKNRYSFYYGEEFVGYENHERKQDIHEPSPQKNFQSNTPENIFKILFNSENTTHALQLVLQLITSHYSLNRGYIFEVSKDEKFISNSFEYCKNNLNPEKQNLQNVPIDMFDFIIKELQNNGQYIVENIHNTPSPIKESYEAKNIKSTMQFGIFNKATFIGFIGFDDTETERKYTEAEINELKILSKIIGIFILKKYEE